MISIAGNTFENAEYTGSYDDSNVHRITFSIDFNKRLLDFFEGIFNNIMQINVTTETGVFNCLIESLSDSLSDISVTFREI